MITEPQLKTIIYKFVKSSVLAATVNGVVTKRKRPTNSTSEDIVVSVLTGTFTQTQSFFVNVNIYVPYKATNNEEDSERVQELSIISANVFKSSVGFNLGNYDYLLSLDTQHVEDLSDIKHSVINNKLLILNQ